MYFKFGETEYEDIEEGEEVDEEGEIRYLNNGGDSLSVQPFGFAEFQQQHMPSLAPEVWEY